MYKIGKAAELAGTTPRTLKWYEELALLPKCERTPGGFRLYSDDDITVIRRIQKMQGLGLSLQVIREILQHELVIDRTGRLRTPTKHLIALVDTLKAQRADIAKRVETLRSDLAAGEELLARIDQDTAILTNGIRKLLAEELDTPTPHPERGPSDE